MNVVIRMTETFMTAKELAHEWLNNVPMFSKLRTKLKAV
jgi:hypothetical protein